MREGEGERCVEVARWFTPRSMGAEYLRGMETEIENLTSVPRCGAEMQERALGAATVAQCPDGHGVFLSRADLGVLVEARDGLARPSRSAHGPDAADHRGHDRRPPSTGKQSRAWVETLFG